MSLRALFFLACVTSATAAPLKNPQAPETDIVATVGPRPILAQDVLERIELMPWPGKDRPSMHDSVAVQATLSLVAEKLLSLRATALGIGLDEESRARFASLERALARDELYRQEIAARVVLTPEESSVALRRFAVQLRLAVFAVRDEEEAQRLARHLSARSRGAGGPGQVTVVRTDTVRISFGELARAHEDAAFALRRPPEARASFTRTSGWLVLQLLERRPNPAAVSLSTGDRALGAEKLLRKRKQAELSFDYWDRIAAGIPISMDSILFNAIADTLLPVMRGDVAAHRKGKAYGVLETDVHRLWRAFRPERERPFIVHGRDTVSLGRVIGAMVFHPMQMQSLGDRVFREDLNRAMITVAEAELVSEHAMRQGFNGHPDVRRDLGTWTEAWQTGEIVRRILDSAAADGDTLARPGDNPLDTYIARLASEHGVTIDLPKVRQLRFTPVNIVTRRLIGFGGTLPAVPLLPHLWEWFTAWNRNQRQQP